MVPRHLMLLVLTVVAAAGCRAAGAGSATRPEPIATRPRLEADAVIAQINRNARQVRSLKAEPSITVIANHEKHPLDGRMAMERPRNFKLELFAPTLTQAKEVDIGSNDAGFWFFVRRSKEKEYYVCNYEESGASPLEAAFQPEWIVEALGLREIPDDEVKSYTVKQGTGSYAGTLILTQRRQARGGEAYTKMMIVEASTGLIREHRLYEGDQKTLLARAVIPQGRYQQIALRPSSGGEGESSVILPAKIQLTWVKEQLELIVDLGRPKINAEFSPDLFEEPTFKGYARHNLADDNAGPAHGPATFRQTRPAPSAGVRLYGPEPIGAERATWAPGDATPGGAELARTTERVVGARMPTAPVPDLLKPDSTSWARAGAREFEP